MPTPVNVFTGYLGSGKTTIIMGLIRQLPADYRSVWLKNEFGDVDVDSQLARENNIEVKQILNGCLCCVLVGRLGDALEEIIGQYHPDRIIVETSGSAYPAPIAVEIRRHPDTLKLDSIVTVIDALNFTGYRDKSFTAKLQAQYTDLILVNKHESLTERQLDDVLDDVYDLNLDTPKIKTDRGRIDPGLVFGLDTKLFESQEQADEADRGKDVRHHDLEVELIQVRTDKTLDRQAFETFLKSLPPDQFFRIKGALVFPEGRFLMNYVFGRYDFQELRRYDGGTQIIFMGRGLADRVEGIRAALGLADGEVERK